jgi:DNA-binding GntR family transcriptional regulator
MFRLADSIAVAGRVGFLQSTPETAAIIAETPALAAPGPVGLRQTIYDRVRDAIRQDILDGVWGHGSRLKIAPLIARYGVSPAPIREALSRLEAEGLIVLHPNRGARVRPIDEAFIRDLYEVRLALEPMLVARSVASAEPHHIAEVAAIQDEFEAAVARRDTGSVNRLNSLFHRRIYQIRPNVEALRLMDQHATVMSMIRRRFGFASGRLDEIVTEHRRLIDACRRRDAESAAAIMRAHIEHSIVDLLTQRRNAAS